MKLFTSIKNERGGKKSTGDDTRIITELSYGNRVVGELALYAIKGTDLKGNEVSGYRVLWNGKVIEQEEKTGEMQKGECKECRQGYCDTHGTIPM